MMFKDNYNNQINNIKPDRYIKDKIRGKLTETEVKKSKLNKKMFFGTAVAAVLCGAVLLSVINNLNRHPSKIQNQNLLKTANDYGDIYSTLEGFKPSILDNIIDFATGGIKEEVMYENAIDDADGAVTENYSKPAAGNSTNTNASNKTSSNSNKTDHSETTTQVEGVDESDIVKTDGKNIYILKRNTVKIMSVSKDEPKQLSDIKIDNNIHSADMYLNGDRLVILGGVDNKKELNAVIYDIKNPEKPKKLQICTQSGYITSSRLIGNKLYIISNYYVNLNDMTKKEEKSFVPYLTCEDYDGAVSADSVHFYDNCQNPEYTVICAYDITDGSLLSTQSVLGGSHTVYASTKNIITAGYSYDGKTQIARFKTDNGKIELKATGELNGDLLNQFSIDEYKNHFRFVLTDYAMVEAENQNAKNSSTVKYIVRSNRMVNTLVILDGDLKETGKITNIAPDERVYSVRFMGDIAYFVTFRQVDPLFSVDVSDPRNPKIIGSLKIPGFSNYLFPYGEGKLLGIGQDADEYTGRSGNVKLSMFDISDPSNVTEGNKTLLPSTFSAALNDHRSSLIDYNKNIIGLPSYTNTGISYYIYSFENGEFKLKLETKFSKVFSICRGLYIGEKFYVVTEDVLEYFDLNSFEKLGTMKIE